MTALEPIHPGEHLSEIMSELGITQYRLAKTIGVPQVRIHDIVHCRRSITADTALRIGKALGMTPDFWLNLQRSTTWTWLAGQPMSAQLSLLSRWLRAKNGVFDAIHTKAAQTNC